VVIVGNEHGVAIGESEKAEIEVRYDGKKLVLKP
jgi:hypothetical protein